MELGQRRREVGEAIWLWTLLGMYSQESAEEWWVVCSGGEISDERLGVYLDVSAALAKKWRVKLERLGMIRTEMVRRLNRKFWIRALDQADRQQVLPPVPVSQLVH
jgi:hypothetical protein